MSESLGCGPGTNNPTCLGNTQTQPTGPSNPLGFGSVALQPYQNSRLGFGISHPASWQVNAAVASHVKFDAKDGSYFVVHVKNANGETVPKWTAEVWIAD